MVLNNRKLEKGRKTLCKGLKVGGSIKVDLVDLVDLLDLVDFFK